MISVKSKSKGIWLRVMSVAVEYTYLCVFVFACKCVLVVFIIIKPVVIIIIIIIDILILPLTHLYWQIERIAFFRSQPWIPRLHHRTINIAIWPKINSTRRLKPQRPGCWRRTVKYVMSYFTVLGSTNPTSGTIFVTSCYSDKVFWIPWNHCEPNGPTVNSVTE